jgi:competence ComEA-like helix-hairpin-helix protein
MDLNAASLSQLEHLPGVGFIIAQSIIAYRDVNGPFSSVEELADVPGVTREYAVELSTYLDVALAAPTKAVSPAQAPAAAPAVLKATDDATLLGARQAVIDNNLQQAAQSYASLINQDLHLDDVIQDLKDALRRMPKDFNLWQTLGDAYLRKDQLQEALDAYSRAEELLR